MASISLLLPRDAARAACAPFVLAAAGLFACLASSAGCDGSQGGGRGAGDADRASRVYALSTLVWSDEGPMGYVALTDTLDVEGEVSLSTAREFSGYTSIAVADGQLLVTNAEDPTLHRYAISDELGWEDRGTLSMLGQGVTDSGFYRQYLARGRFGYAEIDAAQRLVWDPIGFTLGARKRDTSLPLAQDGLDLFANFNRTYQVFDGAILRPFSYHDQDWLRWADGSQIVVYDRDTHDESAVIDAPCPGLDVASVDEAGNTYFSTWEYPALHALMGTGAAPCVVRITPDHVLDEQWDPDLRSWTGGKHVVNFRYLRDDKALAAVLHHEEFGEDVDFKRDFEDPDGFWEATYQHHRLWLFDLARREAEPVRGLPGGDFTPFFAHVQLDGRVFVMSHALDRSRTTVYELSLEGEAVERFQVPGTTYQWVQVR